ncbi:hypothetical protein [Methylosinus sp. Sm6]|uniref:hypothetical protein n=1 Tax=Methylosinus sp. Sm6 TaxID=2866948 RepID=UPI001C99311D|nr:hypothetical protein [Methylosinus sp. Sm6]MBY6242477.1 hypothetical protein [Methylosinus sp. Sm6]
MLVVDNVKEIVKKTPLAVPYILVKNLTTRATSQSNEAEILRRIVSRLDIPKCFIEFGFSGFEFNTVELAKKRDWKGLLVDGGAYNVRIARLTLHRGIRAEEMWIDLDSLERILDYAKSKKVGVLSVDVDGNDFWFLEKLITIRPAVIVAEFNVSLGLRPITVPYDPAFDRKKKHETGEYYGASIAAIDYLCANNDYSLVEISRNGVNAFFVRNDVLAGHWKKIDIDDVPLTKSYPDGSLAPTDKFWQQIKAMPFIDVTKMAAACVS